MDAKPSCSIETCEKPIANSRGWCDTHYRRWLRQGDPTILKPRGPRPRLTSDLPEWKVCSKCREKKSINAFTKANRNGRRGDCRACRSTYSAQWYESLSEAEKRARSNIPGKKEYMAEYNRLHSVRLKEQKRVWVEENRERHRANVRAAMRRRRSTPKGRLESNVARAVHRALNGKKNGEPSFEVLGFSVEELTAHLERQFSRGMTWENYGDWHVDHIRPLASFQYHTASDPQFREAWALTNLRPFWGVENISKGARRLLLV